MEYVIYTLIGCNLLVIGLFIRAGVRVARLENALRDMDWEALANLVGDVATLKRTIQKLNMRLNGICLLYTSPSPRDLRLSRMPSSA